LVEEGIELTAMNVSEATALAMKTHRYGHLVEAEALYRCILQALPLHPPAIHGLGRLLHQRGRHEQALALIQASVRLAPACAAYWNVYGEMLQCHNRCEDAGAAFRQAIALQPNFVKALCSLGNVLSQQGQLAEAVEYYCRAIVANPQRSKSRAMLATGYSALGCIEQAAAVYRQWLDDEPGNPIAAHLYAACSGLDIPERASDQYVETTFDEFAATFDEQLLGHLSYQVPGLVGAAVEKVIPSSSRRHGLDAGCGTGLCGPVIRPYVAHLTGVDLSSNMLALAQQRGVYDELIRAELTDYLALGFAVFDLIVMADTLIYFGALEKVFAAVHQALRCGGSFIFTVENASPLPAAPDYVLNSQGRYGHDHDYIRATLMACGFAISAVVVSTLRLELGLPVEGSVFTAIKP
jgi:predicted TPR repeat methyltransferase